MFNPIITNNEGGIKIVINNSTNENSEDSATHDSKIKYQIDRWLQHF